MSDAYVIGSFSTPFGKWTDKDHRVLARDAVLGVLEDAGLADGSALEQAYFGNCLMHTIGQTMIRDQTCLSDLMDQGVLPERLPDPLTWAAPTASSVIGGSAPHRLPDWCR